MSTAGSPTASTPSPSAGPVQPMPAPAPAKLSEVEGIKARSALLRGTIAQSLEDPLTGAIAPDDTQLIKFHGSYQQDDRDVREERRHQKLEPDYSFMIRTRLPGGVCSPRQWLALDALATKYGSGTLRLTTRQAFQLHGVVKRQLKATMASINAALIDTIAACGDVNRNVLCNPNPVASRVHAEVHGWAVRLSEHLLPKTRAYSELWLDAEKVSGGEEEPLYGPTYLPRKFKAAFAVPPLNDVDVLAHDLGFIAILDAEHLVGFDVSVGGGLGATHAEASTFPRLADVVGFVTPDALLRVAEEVVKVQRDFGDRTNRKHARLKYTIEDRGLPWFRAELERRLGFSLQPPRPFAFEHNGDRYGWSRGFDGRWHLNLFIESGRVADGAAGPLLTGLREIARVHTGDFRLTPNQNVIVANVEEKDRPRLEALVREHGLDRHERVTPLHREALACVALPTCSLAMAEAERALPALVLALDGLLTEQGLPKERLHFRVTGCPNGCARPSLAEVALVGKGPGRYNLHLGGDVRGQRLNALYRENLDQAGILAALAPLFGAFAAQRAPGEPFGDFLHRSGLLSSPTPGGSR
jgi:sulfite reductase (NADPH) hemoprotein beta-component